MTNATRIAALEAQVATLLTEVQRAHARLDEAARASASAHARLDKAAEVIKALRERPAPQTQEPRLGKSDLRAWHIALSQLREERGLAPTAFVKRQDILDRIASNKA